MRTSSHHTTFYPPFQGPSNAPPSPLTPAHFLPLVPHPNNAAPAEPPRLPLPPLPDGWVRSYHAVPAAYPRQLREAHGTLTRDSHPFGRGPVGEETKAERRARVNREAYVATRVRFHAEEWSIEDALAAAPKGLFIAAERWRRETPRGGKTLVCTHPNSTQKEHWHPVMYELLAMESQTNGLVYGTTSPTRNDVPVVIDDIWLFDDCTHGSSVDLNDGIIGPAQTWEDTGRDILNFVPHVLPGVKQTLSQDLGWQLPWLPEGAAQLIPVTGMGGSFGGTGQICAAHARPDVFEAIFLVDPMCPPREVWTLEWVEREGIDKTVFRARDSLKRRDTWVCRQAAREALTATPFFQRWDTRTLELIITHGLVPVDPSEPNGPVTLATPGFQECAVFVEPTAAARAWDRLSTLQVPTAFLMAGDPERTLGEAVTQELVWRPPLARNERLVGTGHLVMQEDPTQTAAAAWRVLHTLAAGMWGTSPEEIQASCARAVVMSVLMAVVASMHSNAPERWQRRGWCL